MTDPTLPFDRYFLEQASIPIPPAGEQKLYTYSQGGAGQVQFFPTGFTDRNVEDLLGAFAAANDVRQELDREIQDLRGINDGLQRQREQAENRNAQLSAEIDELQAQLREQQLGPPDDEAVQEVSEFLKAWEADSGERKLVVRLRKDGAIQFPVTALRGLLTEVSRLRAVQPPPEDADLAEATAQLAEFMTFWDQVNTVDGTVLGSHVQSLWKKNPGAPPGEGEYVTLPASALRTILAELQRRRLPQPEDTAADPLAPPVPPPPGPDFKAMAADLAALFNRLAANL